MKVRIAVWVAVLCLGLVLSASAQQTAVPAVIPFSGVLPQLPSQPSANVVGVTFYLYASQEGGAPLWMETQNLQPNRSGHYNVSLGAEKPLPVELFSSGEARWLGVQAQGQPEQPRVMLVSVPYAMKAADAETVGGLPPSAFVLAAPLSGGNGDAAGTSSMATAAVPATAVTGTGTVNFVPLWTSTSAIGNSALFQTGSGATTKIGIGNTTPAATLDVSGGAFIRGTLALPATGVATATKGFTSNPYKLTASVFNGTTKTAVAQNFQWQAEPANNNTGTASGTLNLLYASGTGVPAETGLKLSSKGLFTFAPGQKFPGAGVGTVTSVGIIAPASDFTVSGSPITSAGTLALGWTVPPDSLDTASAIVKRDATGAFRAGSIVADASPGYAAALYGSADGIAGVGVEGVDTAGAFPGATSGVLGRTFNPAGLGVYGTAGNSTLGSNLLGSVTAGVWGDSSGSFGVIGTTDGGYSVLGEADSGFGVAGFSNTVSGAGVYGTSTEGNALYGVNNPVGGATDANATLLLTNVSPTSHYVLYAEDLGGVHYVRTSSVGDLAATGAIIGAVKNFKIDHPVEPTNKYLVHSSVESPDMKTIYDGVAELDRAGEASVELPGYFEALNRDFRYQLTSIGAPGPNLYVAEEVSGNHFRIAGGKPGAKVSWQVTGIRHDAWANANRSPVEVEKTGVEKGRYLHPEAFGEPVEKGVSYNAAAALKAPRPIPGPRTKQAPTEKRMQP